MLMATGSGALSAPLCTQTDADGDCALCSDAGLGRRAHPRDDGVGDGGYAKETSDDYKRRQQELIHEHMSSNIRLYDQYCMP